MGRKRKKRKENVVENGLIRAHNKYREDKRKQIYKKAFGPGVSEKDRAELAREMALIDGGDAFSKSLRIHADMFRTNIGDLLNRNAGHPVSFESEASGEDGASEFILVRFIAQVFDVESEEEHVQTLKKEYSLESVEVYFGEEDAVEPENAEEIRRLLKIADEGMAAPAQ